MEKNNRFVLLRYISFGFYHIQLVYNILYGFVWKLDVAPQNLVFPIEIAIYLMGHSPADTPKYHLNLFYIPEDIPMGYSHYPHQYMSSGW